MKAIDAFGVVKNELYDLIETAMLTVTTFYMYIYIYISASVFEIITFINSRHILLFQILTRRGLENI